MRRSSRLVVVALTLSAVATPLAAQATPTADAIVARYMQRVGGDQRLRAVLSIRRHGKFYGGGGFEADVTNENRRPNKVREEFTFGGLTGVTAFDGKSGWKIEPWAGKKDAEPLGEDETKGIVEDAEFDDPLFDSKERGNTVALVGMDQVEGTDVYKLTVTLASNGDVRTYYLDAESCVPIKYEVKRTVRGAERWFEVELGDYKEVQGVLLPFSYAIGAKGSASADKAQYSWDRITINPVVDDKRFAKPAAGDKVVPADAAGQPGTLGPSPSTLPAPAPNASGFRAAPSSVVADSETISGLGARNIGSAAMSGRVTSIAAVHEGDRLTVYIGAASGGVWKSMNGGTTFTPMFDKQDVQSIGAIAIDPKDPKTIWAGTGEAWTRNSVSIGDGIYKSTDGGENWTNVGLRESERIAKILVDPTNRQHRVRLRDRARLWSDSDDRGVYNTTDGGKTWTKVLAGANASTGCSLMTMDPSIAENIVRRHVGFPAQGLDVPVRRRRTRQAECERIVQEPPTVATTWTELDDKSTKGLPASPWGRVAVTVAPSKPNVVYAFIEAVPPLNGLYRSDDGGETWEHRDRSQNMVWRPFYFANLIVDPRNENRVFKPDGVAHREHRRRRELRADRRRRRTATSTTSGSIRSNTDHLIVGDDGGLWYSYDGGNKWWKAENLPISQFYHVSVDMDEPYHVYGGLQDNSSWVGESQFPGGITNEPLGKSVRRRRLLDVRRPVATRPTSTPNRRVATSAGSTARRTRSATSSRCANYDEKKLRFNWNTPIHMSPNQKGTLYIGAQFLFRSRDHGQTWERISPDLTTNDPTKQQQEQSGGITVDNSTRRDAHDDLRDL